MELALAPMEGLVDDVLRDVLTGVGGIDWCVSEFLRVTRNLLPERCFTSIAPELRRGARTRSGTPMRLQLLGSDPQCLADNAIRACALGAPVIDLNFGCPAKTVNKSRGGAVLLQEPELLYDIVKTIRASIPEQIPVTGKMRIGYLDTRPALECAQALSEAGAAQIVVHARTKLDGYRPPAHWEWVARIREVVNTGVPVYANGEIWTVEDWQRCKQISGAEHFMLGRGLVAKPDLALQIKAAAEGRTLEPMLWPDIMPLVQNFWRLLRAKVPAQFAPGRLKQWLCWLRQTYPEADAMFLEYRRETDARKWDAVILNGAAGPMGWRDAA